MAGGLEAEDGELTGFTLAGGDKRFHPAKVTINGKSVVVSSRRAIPSAPFYVRAQDSSAARSRARQMGRLSRDSNARGRISALRRCNAPPTGSPNAHQIANRQLARRLRSRSLLILLLLT